MKHIRSQIVRWLKPSGAVLTALCGLALGVSSASATLSVYEPFNYTTSIPNNTPGTGLGETGNWTNGTTPSIVTGLTYPALPVANSGIATTGVRMFVNLATPLSSGTKYVSFLFKCSGDPGGNADGIFLKGDQTTSLWVGFRGPNDGIRNVFGLGSVTSAGTATTGVSGLGSSVNISNAAVHLIVLKIDFDTSGANDTVTLYVDPLANTNAPSVAATTTVTTFNVGTISAFGLNAQGGTTMTFDEFRQSDNFGDVVGFAASVPTVPTGLSATPGSNAVFLSWTASGNSPSSYNVKRSTNSGSGYVTVGTTTAPTVAFTNAALGGVTYYYVVSAVNGSGESGNSTEASVTPFLAAPAAPTALNGTPTNNSVSLTWTAALFADTYNVKRSTTSGAEVTITNVASTNFTDATAVDGTVYYYEVSAVNGVGEGLNSSEKTVTMPPAIVTGLGATAGTNSVSLSWTGAAGATGYRVKRSTTSGSGYVTVGTTATTALIDPITAAGTYYYVVTATNLSGESLISSEVSATPTLAAPSAPTGLAAVAGDNNVSLTWVAASFTASYNVKRSTTSGSGYTTISTTGAVTGTNYSDATAVNGTTYYYVVSGTNAAGESVNSSEVSATPAFIALYEPFNYGSLANGTVATGLGETGTWTAGANAPVITTGLTYTGLPTANSGLLSTATSGRQYVNFATPTGSGTKWVSFLFKCSGDPGGNWVGVYLKGDQANSLWAGFHGAVNGAVNTFGLATITTAGTAGTTGTPVGTTANIGNTTTHLIVLKIDFNNTSGTNDTVTLYIDPLANTNAPSVASTTSVNTLDIGTISAIGVNSQTSGMTVDEFRTGSSFGDVVGYNPPTTPTGVMAVAGTNLVNLTWNAVGTATGYKISRGISTGVYTTNFFTATNAYVDNSAVGGTTYFYAVQATNASGPSPLSAEVMATPVIAPPAVPVGVTATGTNGAVQLNWGSAVGAASYNVKRSTTSGAEATITNVVANSYHDTDVINGVQYFYKVSSVNGTGESGDSSEVSATPNVPPAAPTGLAATPGNDQVALSWTGSAGAVSYNVKRSTNSGSGYALVGTTTAPTVAFTDNTAIKFTTYYYVVSAVSGYGESSDSSEVSATPTGTYGPSAYEPFDYVSLANGTPSTAAGFTGNWNVSGTPSIVTGLTYTGLPTTNNSYSHGAAGAQTTVNFASPVSGGTKYISFLIQGSGNPGGNACGIFLKGDNATSLFVGFEGGFSPDLTSFGLGSVSSTSLGGATALGATTAISNTTVHLVVVSIDFNTSGANDTVSLWIDPPAGVVTPGVSPNVVYSAFDVGTISAFGININGAFPIGIDEVRVGEVYGDVVGYALSNPVNSTPTNIISALAGDQLTLSWPSDHTGWKLQTQTNSRSVGLNGTWYDVTGSGATNQVTVTVDPTQPTVFYRMTYP